MLVRQFTDHWLKQMVAEGQLWQERLRIKMSRPLVTVVSDQEEEAAK